MRTISRTLTLLLLSAAVSASAGTFVSLKGDFYFDYPEDWVQVDHRVVDAHLLANRAGEAVLDYEAAFSPAASVPFFAGPYFILNVDTAGGGYSQAQIDSAVGDMERKYGRGIKYFPVADFLADMESSAPSFDRSTGTISVVSDITERGEVVKKHLLVTRFYDKGAATFYFYSPDSLFGDAERVFNQVLASFHAGNAADMLPKEQLRVAEINTEQSESAKKGRFIVWIAVAVIAMFIVVLMLQARRKRNK